MVRNQSYYDFLKGIDILTLEQKEVLFDRLKAEIIKSKSIQPEPIAEKIISKTDRLQVYTGIESERMQSDLKCCVHCGSIGIKKHGTTRAGIQRYICKDCEKTFSANYGLITHYSHLGKWQWEEIIRGTVLHLSITEIAKNIGTSTSTVWGCRLKIYQSLQNIYGQKDTFNSLVEADGKYERISFKGCRNKEFFIDTLGRMPRHHRSKNDKEDYLRACNRYEKLFKENPHLLKEMLFSSQKRMVGRDTIDINHQHVCILTAIDRNNNIYIEPITSGAPDSSDIYKKLSGRIEKDAVLITDDHHSYKFYTRKEQIEHVKVHGGTYTNGAYSLSRVNALHSLLDRFISRTLGNTPATKYLDLYLEMFWWKQKNKDLNTNGLCSRLYAIMNGQISHEARAQMGKITIKSLISRKLPIDTKGYY